MFHLLLGDLSRQFRENCLLTKSALSLTSEEMQMWENLNGIDETDKTVSKYKCLITKVPANVASCN